MTKLSPQQAEEVAVMIKAAVEQVTKNFNKLIEDFETKINEKDQIIADLIKEQTAAAAITKENAKSVVKDSKPILNYASCFNNSKQPHTTEQLITIARLSNEMKEKQKKSSNIVISGIAECKSNDQKEIDEFDLNKVKQVLTVIIGAETSNHSIDDINKYLTTTIKKVSRIRNCKSKQDTNGKVANILVEFKNLADPADMLIRAKYLKTSKGYESIYINPDMTAAELKIAYALRKERKEKRELETAVKQDKLIA